MRRCPLVTPPSPQHPSLDVPFRPSTSFHPPTQRFSRWYPGQESNLYLEFRKPSFYPLNYRDTLLDPGWIKSPMPLVSTAGYTFNMKTSAEPWQQRTMQTFIEASRRP